MIQFDLTSIITGVVGLGAGLASFNHHVRGLAKRVEPVIEKVEHVYENVKNNHQVKTTVQEIQTALTAETATECESSIKAAIFCAIQTLGSDISSLSDVEKAAIAKYVKDVVPQKFKNEITAGKINSALTLISNELEAAKQNDGIKAAQAFISYLNEPKQQPDTPQPSDQPQQNNVPSPVVTQQ